MQSHDPKEFVLNRELSEVHLLLDNLSANPDKTVDLTMIDANHKLQPAWLEDICKISWPPEDAPKESAAAQAALLIRAKDCLNTLAKPASGATIAFTLLVTQEESPSAIAATNSGDAPSRRSLARDAYPGLIRKAMAFRLFMSWMGWVLCALLIFTCVLSWYVAFGNATLVQGASAQATLVAAQKAVDDAETGIEGRPDASGAQPKSAPAAPVPAPTSAPAAAVKPAVAGTSKAAPRYVMNICDRARLIPTMPGEYRPILQFESVVQMQSCDAERKAERSVRSIDHLLRSWLGVLAPSRGGSRSDPADNFQETLVYAGSLVHIMAASVLPVLYGVLGAAASVVRSLSRKIKLSTLAPRDLLLSWQQLGLGAVMGACIGLFVAQPATGSGGNDSAGLIGSIALSSSALSFVAGFGVEQVFMALEALIGRIFAVVNTAPPK